ncbi:molybdopterin converting factor subunit 1 [Magnetospira sp. QH-2]|uniref:molybdopterin converting factor subunit 1 n=1 Tax=Magnetospira sp. (strain QH-2) TaxID=1288970 RepID=UPI0003E80F5A|nr:molybdopterin converting factor subunit 1 [Magnetospira sp. QH-2]CCQ74864.1 Molybdopterin-converting factor subunit 1 [Magnetospira sp. QH-2]
MKMLYFAWFRERIGTGEEDLTPPANVTTVGALLDWLKGQGAGYAAALEDPALVRVAVNQDYVGSDSPVSATDEVALFPPVTGG